MKNICVLLYMYFDAYVYAFQRKTCENLPYKRFKRESKEKGERVGKQEYMLLYVYLRLVIA